MHSPQAKQASPSRCRNRSFRRFKLNSVRTPNDASDDGRLAEDSTHRHRNLSTMHVDFYRPYMHVEAGVRHSSKKNILKKSWPPRTDLLAHLSLVAEDTSNTLKRTSDIALSPYSPDRYPIVDPHLTHNPPVNKNCIHLVIWHPQPLPHNHHNRLVRCLG